MGQKLIRGLFPSTFERGRAAIFSIEFERFEGSRFELLVKHAAIPALHHVDGAGDRISRHWRAAGHRLEHDEPEGIGAAREDEHVG